MQAAYGRQLLFLPNGVVMPTGKPDPAVLARFGLESGRYVINVSHIVPEKRQLDLISAYGRLSNPGFKLVLVGGHRPSRRL
ncbi:MAG: hypothetical protein MO852_04335 [Candidatus Devosia euplotis]|nr:hypothetical protein [Candidatus Devosia euplotis]